MKEMLVFVRAGHKSLHREWRYDRERVDVWVSSYVEGLQDASVARVVTGGYNKFSHFAELVTAGEIRLADYDYFFLVDDDIAIDWPLEDLPRLARKHGLKIGQPALNWGSFHSFSFLLSNPFCSRRTVGLVEVMCPLFSREALAAVLPTFTLSRSTWGIDLAYCSLAERSGWALTVLDTLGVNHCKEISMGSGAWYAKLRADGVDPEQELAAIQRDYGELKKRTLSFAPRFCCPEFLARGFERIKPRLRRWLSERGWLRVRRMPA